MKEAVARFGRPVAARVMGLDMITLKLDGEGVAGGAAGDDGLRGGAGGSEGEVGVRSGAGADGDELWGGGAGGEVGGSAVVARCRSVEPWVMRRDGEDRVSAGGERCGEEGGGAVEEGDGAGGCAGGGVATWAVRVRRSQWSLVAMRLLRVMTVGAGAMVRVGGIDAIGVVPCCWAGEGCGDWIGSGG